MGKRQEERERAAALCEEWAERLETGKCMHYWDAEHQPRKAEKLGRAKMLRHLAKEIKRGHKEAKED